MNEDARVFIGRRGLACRRRVAVSLIFLSMISSSGPNWAGQSEAPKPDDDNDLWEYHLYLDMSYADDLGGSKATPWRFKQTTTRLNDFDPNMGMLYVEKTISAESPWGMQFGIQAGNDASAQESNWENRTASDVIKHFGHANFSYQPTDKLTLTAGLMESFIGFESIYAKYNPNYTRAWIADYSPYFLIGAGGHYIINSDVSARFFLVTDYNYMEFVNNQPKYAGQFAWKFAPEWTLRQNIFFGPEQQQTDLKYWLGFSDTELQWQTDELMIGWAYNIGTEQQVRNDQQAFWMGSALWTRWQINTPWSIAFRPELFWDPDGLQTGVNQFLGALTLTTEYQVKLLDSSLAVRTEFRHDTSTDGPNSGFYNAAKSNPTLPPYISGQNLFFISLLWSYDNSFAQSYRSINNTLRNPL
jgi:hypothetical protein